ncbi:MAG: hypothetical protein A2268_13930 [Candidatus Raymondbacteria bacterium RifOxyA12_full_50_37]|uniref:PEGA domain-containing protein n=1 Tax=Candidatus Raymondbacteria bacterium RIFOXYD12_FULL_49_13 TaxID=1817890 RepID=A0A1F7FKH6_UNCRA|nr:MAG: hypothetical protein A2268_13930 [Candidatus Raymondbacteria bacterium RifOxyA12_full_50_37]OGJ88178.1 MAG: hypothetical protein A2248_19270 [Candidatus Raymondbacteria bacterium RIFOXYA2_FULL_49_16]OGJ98129.1 MAG: hypothetical protein A2350_00190 [Candidatus Raymondbacteria bacterium RifOxyB12_full_50_8]OGJ98410.1 MAG: hypothetical protein A2487_02710 [Candidatus Raymondbacteria bacterium RifOxyC12_full_50_8]OGK07224.1 MAG: hypothetical protein A2519_13935 [Candidatus Raymondbacteria b
MDLCAFVLATCPLYAAHTLVLGEFTNQSGNPALDSIQSVLETELIRQAGGHGLQVVGVSQAGEETGISAAADRSILHVQANAGSPAIITATIETGSTSKTHEKTILYNSEESIAQNMTILIVKILHVLEEQASARVQIFSEPSEAQLVINRKIMAATPWESVLPYGSHQVNLMKNKYAPISETIAVVPGNNQFRYTLAGLQAEKPRITPITLGPAERPVAVYWAIIAGSALFFASAQFLHASADNEYTDLVSGNAKDYDRLHEKAQQYLYLRNISIVTFSGASLWALYKILK